MNYAGKQIKKIIILFLAISPLLNAHAATMTRCHGIDEVGFTIQENKDVKQIDFTRNGKGDDEKSPTLKLKSFTEKTILSRHKSYKQFVASAQISDFYESVQVGGRGWTAKQSADAIKEAEKMEFQNVICESFDLSE